MFHNLKDWILDTQYARKDVPDKVRELLPKALIGEHYVGFLKTFDDKLYKSLWWDRKHWEGEDRDDTLFLVGITMRIYFVKVDATYYVKTYNIEKNGYPKLDSMTTQEQKDLSYFKGVLLHNSYTMIIDRKGDFVPHKQLADWYFKSNFAETMK